MGKKGLSRTERWIAAIQEARNQCDALKEALSSLKDVQSEYKEWKDNLPENLQQGAMAKKLEEVCNVDIDNAYGYCDDIASMLDDAEGLDLPKGFGRY